MCSRYILFATTKPILCNAVLIMCINFAQRKEGLGKVGSINQAILSIRLKFIIFFNTSCENENKSLSWNCWNSWYYFLLVNVAWINTHSTFILRDFRKPKSMRTKKLYSYFSYYGCYHNILLHLYLSGIKAVCIYNIKPG